MGDMSLLCLRQLTSHELSQSVILAFKEKHFSYNLASKHKPVTSSCAQPEEELSWVILAEDDLATPSGFRSLHRQDSHVLFCEICTWCLWMIMHGSSSFTTSSNDSVQ